MDDDIETAADRSREFLLQQAGIIKQAATEIQQESRDLRRKFISLTLTPEYKAFKFSRTKFLLKQESLHAKIDDLKALAAEHYIRFGEINPVAGLHIIAAGSVYQSVRIDDEPTRIDPCDFA